MKQFGQANNVITRQAHWLKMEGDESYQVLNAGNMRRVYCDRIIKAVFSIGVFFLNLKDTTTLQRT